MKIVTDCAADLSAEEAAELGITVAPLFIHFPDGELSSDQLTIDEFYLRLEAMAPSIPTTSQPSSAVFSTIYQKLAALGEEVVSIHISSGLSGTINSALQGASQAAGAVVHVFDSMTLSGGERFQVLAAQRAAKAGWKFEAIQKRLTEIRKHTEVAYTLETLTYLRRGGRIGRVQALAGALLHIKPLIRVEREDGKYSTFGKSRTIPQALELLADHMAKEYGETAVWVSVMHGKFHEQAEALKKLIESRMNAANVELMRISPVLGVHTGPGVVGAAVVPVSLMQDFPAA